MKYTGTLFAVKNIDEAVAFYQDLFDLKIDYDFGRCKMFEGGLTLQQDFDWLAGIDKRDMAQRENNCEIVFESSDFDAFVARLKARADTALLHDVMEHDWGQRAIRFYDLDGHLIEVDENMGAVVERFFASGLSAEQIAVRMDISVGDVARLRAQ